MRRNVVALTALGTALSLAASACSGGSGDSEAEGATKPPPQPSAPASTEPPKKPFTIAFGGDVHFEGVLRPRLANPSTAFGPIEKTLKKADLAMVNLETAITTGGTQAPNKAYAFRAPPSAFKALKAAGVDVTSMANNHGMDFMQSGLKDSLRAIKKTGFPTVGIGKDAEQAYGAWRTTVKGNKVAVVGATQVMDNHLIQAWTATDGKGGLASAKDVPRMVQAVKDAAKGSDVVIVHLHWGQELNDCPLPRQKDLADKLVAAGADVIVGGHAHVLLGGGYKRGAFVHYGLGNFLFYSGSGPTAESGVLTLKINDGRVVSDKWKPARISAGVPRPLSGPSAKSAIRKYKKLRGCTGLNAKP